MRVKGKNEPVRIFELIQDGDAEGVLAQRLEIFNRGFELYHQRQFEKAIKEFNSSLNIEAEDRVSQLYIDRCRDYIDNPPTDDWDGVFVMTTK